MFHELWLESNKFCRKILSVAQRLLLLTLCRKLTPFSVHTSNQNYAEKLANSGISASVLPVFSNIDVAPPHKQVRPNLLKKFNLELNDPVWIFVFFGSIHPGWDYACFMEQVSKAAISSRKDAVIFLSIGKNQGVGAKIWNSMQSLPNHIIRFLRLGELPENEVSQFLHSADFGVATTQLSLLGKSGTAAAYARHGLPTIIPRIDISDDKKMQDFKGIIQLDKYFEQSLLNPPKPLKSNSARQTAEFLMQNFEFLQIKQ